MKKQLILVTAVTLLSCSLMGQIAIDQSDMPGAGDTLRVSITNVVPEGYDRTGQDTTWNFNALAALSQRVDTFMAATSAPAIYQLFFVLAGGANLASPAGGGPVPGLPVSQGFTFYKNSASSFSNLGTGYTLQGIPLPAKYDNPELLYQFPMPPGTTWSSVSAFALPVPGIAYYSTSRTRSSVVDGWGDLTIPFGTFPVVRVKSILHLHDSIYIDSLGIGFPFNRDITEYKWLAKNMGIPVLQINEEGSLVTATYRDIPRMSAQPLTVNLGPDTVVFKGTLISLHAAITGGTPPFQVFWSSLDTGSTITFAVQEDQTLTVLVVDALQNFASDQITISLKYPPGFGESLPSLPFRLIPNPSRGTLTLESESATGAVGLSLVTIAGTTVFSQQLRPGQTADIAFLPDGLYFAVIRMGKETWHKRIILQR